ncbi:MAG: hypothetical protein ABW034_22150, partial [Steroidobacteraceae bacterium]
MIKVRRGNEGGLYANNPNPIHFLDFARIYFRPVTLDAKQMAQLREHLGSNAVTLCASKLSTTGVFTLRDHAEQLRREMDAVSAGKIAREIGRLILTYSGNRALLLFRQVLFALRHDERGGLDVVYRPRASGER